jgi:hypothetical protein
MTPVVYGDYTRGRIGWFFGLSGWQVGVVAGGVVPVAVALNRGQWAAAAVLALVWAGVVVVTVVPVGGRSVTGWVVAVTGFAWGSLAGWTRFRAAATRGWVEDLGAADLPGVLQGVQVHDGPPWAVTGTRPAIIQDHASRVWAVTAAVVHLGLGLAEPDTRTRWGAGWGELLDLASCTELIEEVLVVVRTVPDDGAERQVWTDRHRRPGTPALARRVTDDLADRLTVASVRTEAFVTLVVPEARIARAARQAGAGVEGRARVLYGLMSEVEAHLRGAAGMLEVTWLTSPRLAVACRTGFAPGDRAGIVEALAAARHDPGVHAGVPWALAGPSGADPAVRHYSHDAWNSVSATVSLPARGAVMGALAPVLIPGEAGERRSLLVAYPILRQAVADRHSATSEWAADLGQELRARARVKQRARSRSDTDRVRGLDTKLARGYALTRPYAVCTVTAAKTARISEYARRLDAAIRRAGFAPLRLDLAHDVAFAASTVPLGVSLTRRGDT